MVRIPVVLVDICCEVGVVNGCGIVARFWYNFQILDMCARVHTEEIYVVSITIVYPIHIYPICIYTARFGVVNNCGIVGRFWTVHRIIMVLLPYSGQFPDSVHTHTRGTM